MDKKLELPKGFKGPFYNFARSPQIIFMKTKQGDTTVIDIRGWGYLTGRGALNMSDDLACEAHDAFANWVVAALNSYSANASGLPPATNNQTGSNE